MTATFNPALTSDLDKIRFAVGDTAVAKAIVQDETIEALLEATGATVASVSALVAQSILTEYQQRVTYDVDGQGERWSDAAKAYASTVSRLVGLAAAEAAAAETETDASLGGGIIVAGISVSSNLDKARDPDRAANYSPRIY